MESTLNGCKWIISASSGSDNRWEEISRSLNIHPIVAKIAALRGVDLSNAQKYFRPALKDLSSPFDIGGMGKAVERILRAVDSHERILIHGDYDADGITAAACLKIFFDRIGAESLVFLPDRLKEGHGISQASLDFALKNGCGLLLTCDVGISAFSEVEAFGKKGIDVVITDHHPPLDKKKLPAAYAVVDPLIDENPVYYPLAGVGVAFYLIMALRKELRERGFFRGVIEPDLKEYLDLVVIGTIADVSPMTGENRILVKQGLRSMGNSLRAGVAALAETGSINATERFTWHDIAFRIAPRINAAGRMGKPQTALELLLEEDLLNALEKARQLERFNIERKKIEQQILGQAARLIEREKGWEAKRSHCVAGRNWHRGVLGLVCSRLSEKYSCPFSVISVDEGVCRGSVRLSEPYSVKGILSKCSGHLLEWGGHELAGGFSIMENEIENFSRKFVETVNSFSTGGIPLKKGLRVDLKVPLEDIDLNLVEELELLSPFGPGNEEPNLLSENLFVAAVGGLGNSHTRVIVKDRNGRSLEALIFGKGVKDPPLLPCRADIVYLPEKRRIGDGREAVLIVKDIRFVG